MLVPIKHHDPPCTKGDHLEAVCEQEIRHGSKCAFLFRATFKTKVGGNVVNPIQQALTSLQYFGFRTLGLEFQKSDRLVNDRVQSLGWNGAGRGKGLRLKKGRICISGRDEELQGRVLVP